MGIAILTLISSTFAGALLIWLFSYGRHQLAIRPPYPSGPPIRGLLSGNAKDLALKFPWLAYTEWAKTYGVSVLQIIRRYEDIHAVLLLKRRRPPTFSRLYSAHYRVKF